MAQSRKYAIRNGFKSWATKLSQAIADGEADVPYLLALQEDVKGYMVLIASGIEKRGAEAELLAASRRFGGESMYQQVAEVRSNWRDKLGAIDETLLNAIYGELRELLDAVTRELESRLNVGFVKAPITLTCREECGTVDAVQGISVSGCLKGP